MQMVTYLLQNFHKILEIKYRWKKSLYPENIPCYLTSVKQIFVFWKKKKIRNILIKQSCSGFSIQFNTQHVSFNSCVFQ